MFEMLEKQPFSKNMIMFLILLLAIAIIVWISSPQSYIELPNTDVNEVPYVAEGYGDIAPTNQPQTDPSVGAIMDGPGFEKNTTEQAGNNNFAAIPSNYYFLDDGAGGEMSVQHNMCSKSCCSNQWPTPFKQKYDPYVCQNKDQFVGSRIFCNNTFQDSGCLCLTKKQAQFLYNRGDNGREWF
jgi:hypothetical protein